MQGHADEQLRTAGRRLQIHPPTLFQHSRYRERLYSLWSTAKAGEGGPSF